MQQLHKSTSALRLIGLFIRFADLAMVAHKLHLVRNHKTKQLPPPLPPAPNTACSWTGEVSSPVGDGLRARIALRGGQEDRKCSPAEDHSKKLKPPKEVAAISPEPERCGAGSDG